MSELTAAIAQLFEPILKRGQYVVINGVSKSGDTTETIPSFEVLVELLKKYKDNYQEYVLVTTDKGSRFWDLARQEGFEVQEIPENVGGRYSVLSPLAPSLRG